MKGPIKFNYVIATLPLLLLFLPGCALVDWISQQFSTDEDIIIATQSIDTVEPEKLTGTPLVWMDGEVIVTTDSLQEERENLFEAQPQLKQIVAIMGEEELNKNLAEGLANQAVVDEYIRRNSIDERDDYKREIEQGYQAVIRMANMKFFQDAHMQEKQVTDAEARKYYEEQKDILPALITSQGGVQTVGVMFENKEDADKFKSELEDMDGTNEQEVRKNVQSLAQEQGYADNVKDFGSINNMSYVDAAVKDKIVAITKTPTITTATSSKGEHWVLVAVDKNPTEYRKFEEIKEELKSMLAQENQSKQFDKQMDTLRGKYKILFDEDYFASSTSGSPMLPDMGMS